MAELTTWMRDNAFLVAQAIATASAVLSIIVYTVNLENRVATLETRGSPHLNIIDNRLTVLESKTDNNKAQIERISEIMLRDFGKAVK